MRVSLYIQQYLFLVIESGERLELGQRKKLLKLSECKSELVYMTKLLRNLVGSRGDIN